MVLLIILLILGLGLSFITFLPFNLLTEWWIYPIMILLGITYAACMLGLIMLLVRFLGLFMDKTKKQIKPNPFFYHIMISMVDIAMVFGNVKVLKTNFRKLPKEKYMFIFNHTSNWDGMMFLNHFKSKKICFVEKIESFSSPVLGDIVYKSGFIPLDRSNKASAIDTIQRSVNKLTNENTCLGIAPEGTRSKDGTLLPFNQGAFTIAILAKKPIVLFGLKHVNDIKKNAPFKRTKVNLDVLEVLYPEFYKNKTEQEICSYCENIYKKYLNQ